MPETGDRSIVANRAPENLSGGNKLKNRSLFTGMENRGQVSPTWGINAPTLCYSSLRNPPNRSFRCHSSASARLPGPGNGQWRSNRLGACLSFFSNAFEWFATFFHAVKLPCLAISFHPILCYGILNLATFSDLASPVSFTCILCHNTKIIKIAVKPR